VADVDLSELVLIRNRETLAEREVPRGALAFFVNDEQPWEQLDAAGRRKAQQTSASTDKKD
jgi:hypothetical protein